MSFFSIIIPIYNNKEKEMTDYIKTHGNEILKDKRVPKRDKFPCTLPKILIACLNGFSRVTG